jgi:hypothetical protein
VVTARVTNGNKPKGIDLHHSSTLRKRDIIIAQRIPCTSIPRTIIDCAPLVETDAELKALIRQSERVHRFDIRKLDHPGTPTNLQRVLDKYVRTSGFTANDMEAAFFEICARAGIPLPDRQVLVGPYRVDFIWEDLKLIVETDGRESHAIATAFVDDRRRDRRNAADGYLTIRFTWAEIEYEPELVLAELRQAVAGPVCG